MLLLEKFNYISVIKNYGMTLKWGGGVGGGGWGVHTLPVLCL